MKKKIDFRSDTVTQPTPEMREAMFQAGVGDDVYGEDPSINALEQKLSKMFGMHDAVFCPSGTMTNQIGLRLHTRPQDEIICADLAHIYLYEGGGMMSNAQCSPCLIPAKNGKLQPEDILKNIKARDVHFPRTRLVALENTVNKAGGVCYSLEEIKAVREVCAEKGLALHLDGARLFNALVKKGENPKEYGKLFDSISICFSKGLGAPVGSALLVKDEEDSFLARRFRKSMGGGMRQAGFLAAACTYALDNHVERLAEDHRRAAHFANEIPALDWVDFVKKPETNLVMLALKSAYSVSDFLAYLQHHGVLTSGMGGQNIRFAFHLHHNDEDVAYTLELIKKYRP